MIINQPRLTILLLISVLFMGGCSLKQMAVRASLPLVESGIAAMNEETDLQLAAQSIPANLGMLEGMSHADPDNSDIHVHLAQGYYGYAYAFTEDGDRARAATIYTKGLKHALKALSASIGSFKTTDTLDTIQAHLNKSNKNDVPALFWAASNWAKWVDMNRHLPASIVQLPKATLLMQRVLDLDESFFHASAHSYFGVYYGARSPIMGGDFSKSEKHFDRARELTNNRLMVVNLLQAQYLERQRYDRDRFRSLLNEIISTPVGIYPELSLMNEVARKKATALLKLEEKWF